MNEGKLGHLEKASVLAASDDPKDQDKAREIKTRFDYESLKRQIGSKKKHSKPAVKEAAGAGGGVPMTPQELEIQKKMSRLSMRLARKRNQNIQKAKIKDTETDPAQPKDEVKEGSLHKWFKGSKSKDGKAGWVNVKTGGTCASDEPGEGTPKCVSSSKRASMSKAERESASRRKKAADPNQQSKSGAAKPTYVRTDSKKKMNEDKVLKTVAKELAGASKMHKGQSEKIKKHLKDMKKVDEACWKGYKAYGMKKKGGKMVPNCKPVGSVKEETVDEACWKGYEKKGMKTMFGKRYPNCVKKTKKEEVEYATEAKVDQGRSDYGKASIRNYRRSGPGHGEPAMFDSENKRGKTIDKRREEHKARRGVKGAKVPAYKVSEENALEKRAKENEKARKWLKKDAKDSGYTDIALKASMSKGAGVNESHATAKKPSERAAIAKLEAILKRKEDLKKQTKGVKEEVIPRGPGGNPIRIKDRIKAAKGHIPNKGKPTTEEVVSELNRYGKETGKATGSINKRAGTPVKTGGSTDDKALTFVRNMIRKETGKPSGQQKKVKGEKGRVQYGDRKTTPADSIAKRRQSAKDADAAMRDTRGT